MRHLYRHILKVLAKINFLRLYCFINECFPFSQFYRFLQGYRFFIGTFRFFIASNRFLQKLQIHNKMFTILQIQRFLYQNGSSNIPKSGFKPLFKHEKRLDTLISLYQTYAFNMVRPVRLELTRLLTRPLNVRVYHSAMAAATIIIYYDFI